MTTHQDQKSIGLVIEITNSSDNQHAYTKK